MCGVGLFSSFSSAPQKRFGRLIQATQLQPTIMVNTRKRKSQPAEESSGGGAAKSYYSRSRRVVVNSSPSSADDASASDTQDAHILMSPRENDFNDKTWWMVDINPIGGEETSRQGATALVKRCMRTYGWDEMKTRKVLNAYRQFIILKKESEDWDAQILSPCFLVDQMWHCHVLDVVNYCHDMMLLCGRVVGHDPDGGLDFVAKQQRDNTTRELLQERFGNYDDEVWDYSEDDDQDGSDNSDDQPEGEGVIGAQRREEETNAMAAENITFRITDQNGEETMFEVRRTIKMGVVFNAFAARKGVDVDSFRFMLDGEVIRYDDTPESLELEDNDQIDCMIHQCGC